MSLYEDEIDLRPYLVAILKKWWQIGLVALALAAAVFAFTFSQPPKYESTATMIVTYREARLELAQEFTTEMISKDYRGRMDAYLVIANSDAIAQDSFNALREQLPESVKNASELKKKININFSGDAIKISARDKSPEIAALIANTWAQKTVATINTVYNTNLPIVEIQTQLENARANYQNAQSALEDFLETNRTTELEAQIRLSQTLLQSATEALSTSISEPFAQKTALEQLIIQAELLKAQLETGNQSNAGDLGDAMAVLAIRSNGLNSSANPKLLQVPQSLSTAGNFFFQVADGTTLIDAPANYASDIDAVIQIAQAEIAALDAQINAFEAGITLDDLMTETALNLQTLESQLESEQSQLKELTSERDLAWKTYQALVEKETEIQTTAQTNIAVALASPAISPTEPISRQTMVKTAIAGLLGAALAVFWIIAANWWKTSQPISSVSTETEK